MMFPFRRPCSLRQAKKLRTLRLAATAAALTLAGGTPTGETNSAEPEDRPPVVAHRENSIVFGQSAAFSGPAQELGWNMRLGIEAAFEEANRRRGADGPKFVLHSLDDAYEPETAIANTRALIGEDVLALIGAVGTPTSAAALPIVAEAKVPYVAPFTGADFLRDTDGDGRNVVNLRASYDDETEAMVAHLIADLGISRISVMYQDDSFGRTGHSGVLRALGKRGMTPVAVGVYPRNTMAVKTALLDLRAGDPDAVILIGTYEPVAQLIAWARRIDFEPVFITTSFVGGNALARMQTAVGVFVTQVVPFPNADAPPIVPAYRRALAASAPDAQPGFVSLEGYLAGRLAVAAVERCRRTTTATDRRCFLNALREVDDLDGFRLRYGDGDNQGSDAIFLSVIDGNGRYRPVTSMSGAMP